MFSFPDDWTVRPLASIAERVMVGIASAATHAYRSKGVPMLRNQNIKRGRLDDSDVLFVDPKYELTFLNKRLRTGDLLTARTGYPGATCVVPQKYDGAQSFTTLIIRPDRRLVDSYYLSYFINSERGQAFVEQGQIGGAQKNINAGTLRTMPIALPELPEQRVIASTLAHADELIRALEQLVAKREAMKLGMMQQLLTGHIRLPGFTDEWTTPRIDDFAEVRAGGTPSTNVAAYWGGEIPWMNSGEIHHKQVVGVSGRITRSGLQESSAHLFPPGTVLMALAGQGRTRGTVAVSRIELTTNQSIAGIYPSASHDSDYLYYNLDARYAELRGESAGGGGRGGLNLSIIKRLPVFMPSRPEQTAIARVLLDADAELDVLRRRLAKMKDLSGGIMQQLLTGRFRLPLGAAS